MTFYKDTTAIIDYPSKTADSEPELCPSGPVQQVVAALLRSFGSNCLLPLAMHYRSGLTAINRNLFLRAEFALAPSRRSLPYDQRLETAGQLMTRFAGFLPNLGVTPEAIPALEGELRELLTVLEAHFRLYPYLLGGRSVADFGLIGPALMPTFRAIQSRGC